jgi:hypothetical protein
MVYDVQATAILPPYPSNGMPIWRNEIPATPIDTDPQFLLPPNQIPFVDPFSSIERAGCTLVRDHYDLECSADNALIKFGCSWFSTLQWVSFSNTEELSLVAECQTLTQDWKNLNPQSLYLVGCAFKRTVGYIFYIKDEYVLLDTRNEIQEIFLPLENPDDALSYVQLMTGLEVVDNFTFDLTLLYLQTNIYSTFVTEDDGIFRMNLYYSKGCSC